MSRDENTIVITCPICGYKNILNCEDVSCRDCNSCRPNLYLKLCTCDERKIIQVLLAQNIQLQVELDYSLQQDSITYVHTEGRGLRPTQVYWKK